MNFLRSLITKYEPLVFTFGKVFVYAFIGLILSYWIGIGDVRVSSLWNDIANQWDTAAGSSLVVGLAAVGFKLPQAIKTKTL